MSEPEAASEARRWLRYALDDLEIAGQMARDAARPRYVCWFSQQAAEKALKAVLVLEGIEFPYIHDLQRLRNLFPDAWPEGAGSDVLARLTAWGSESRYPGDWPEPTADDAASAEADARAVYDSIAAEFGHRGVVVE